MIPPTETVCHQTQFSVFTCEETSRLIMTTARRYIWALAGHRQTGWYFSSRRGSENVLHIFSQVCVCRRITGGSLTSQDTVRLFSHWGSCLFPSEDHCQNVLIQGQILDLVRRPPPSDTIVSLFSVVKTSATAGCSEPLGDIIAPLSQSAAVLNLWCSLIKYLRSAMIKVHPPHLGSKIH